MKKSKEQKVAVFIDVQNLYHTAKNVYKTRVNFGQILRTAVDGRRLIRAFAYVIKTKSGEEKAFFDALSELGIEIRSKDLKEFYSGVKKANWDVGLAVDAICVAPGVDAIVIISGDGDFAPMVEYLKNQGKRVEVVAFGKTTAQELIEVADEFINLDQDSGKYLMKEKFYSRLVKN